MYITATIHLAGDVDPDDREYEIPPAELLELLESGAWYISQKLDYYEGDKMPPLLVKARDTGWDMAKWLREKLENPQ